MTIQISNLKIEGVLQVSKWLKFQVLLDAEEMQDLLQALSPVFFVSVSAPVKPEEAIIDDFLKKYGEYVALLKEGRIPPVEDFRRYFSCALSADLESFYAIDMGDGRQLIKPRRPVIQLQAHHFFYSTLDQKFHPMVLSNESISWGLQFSYPQLFQDPVTRKIVKVGETFPNTALFSRLQKWMRNATLPTPFVAQGKRTNSPIRIGKKSLSWIKNHPQLKQREIDVLEL